jgi:hypothetical protein
MRDFLVSIGSNRRISAGILLAEFKTPWNFLAETNAEGRSPEATSLTNSEWWCYYSICSNLFSRQNKGLNAPPPASDYLVGHQKQKIFFTFSDLTRGRIFLKWKRKFCFWCSALKVSGSWRDFRNSDRK